MRDKDKSLPFCKKCKKFAGISVIICPVCAKDKFYILDKNFVKAMCKECDYRKEFS